MNHRVGRILFALVVSLAVGVFAFQWITDPNPREQRLAEERAVAMARSFVMANVGEASLEIVDPLSPDRKVGKVYVYPEEPGWAVSGYYRRGEGDRWHPYLVQLTAELELHTFKAEDDKLVVK